VFVLFDKKLFVKCWWNSLLQIFNFSRIFLLNRRPLICPKLVPERSCDAFCGRLLATNPISETSPHSQIQVSSKHSSLAVKNCSSLRPENNSRNLQYSNSPLRDDWWIVLAICSWSSNDSDSWDLGFNCKMPSIIFYWPPRESNFIDQLKLFVCFSLLEKSVWVTLCIFFWYN